MIRTAFCDDELHELDNIRQLTDNYIKNRKTEMDYVTYQSPYELLEDIEEGERFDILFLDVIMPGQNGMSVAEEIREHDDNVKIIFLTSSPEYAVQSYTVGAYFYQLKPIWEDSFYRLMDSVISLCDKEQEQSLIVTGKNSVTKVPLKELEYCEVIGRTLFLHLKSGRVIEMSGSMGDFEKKLRKYDNFLRVHRSYLINLDLVRGISARAVSMQCLTDIPIPHGKYTEIKDKYLEHAFKGGDLDVTINDFRS